VAAIYKQFQKSDFFILYKNPAFCPGISFKLFSKTFINLTYDKFKSKHKN